MVISCILSKKLVSVLDRNNIIKHNNAESYEFCIEYLFDVFLYHGSLLVLGAILHELPLTVLYLLIMTPLKKLTGGVHASTRGLCSAISYGIYFTTILFCTVLPGKILTIYNISEIVLYILLFMFLTIAIVSIAPVPHINKPLSNDDKHRLKKWTMLYIIIIGAGYCISIYLKAAKFNILIIICMLITYINLILGKSKNRRSVDDI